MKSGNIVIHTRMCFLVLVIMFFGSNCKKFVEVDAPVTNFTEENVYTNDATAASVLTGIFTKMSVANYGSFDNSFTGISLFAGLSADELTLYDVTNTKFLNYYHNSLSSQSELTNFWNIIYPIIFSANAAIEGLETSNSLTSSVKMQLLGEAKFMRAFCFFNLANLYGDIPLVLNTDWSSNASLARSPQSEVYSQIIADLQDAEELLSEQYMDADLVKTTSERIRPTKWAAASLLARAYLYTQNWAEASAKSTEVINNTLLYELSSLDNVFLKNSSEAIWQLQTVGMDAQSNTGEGDMFILPETGPNNFDYPIYLSDNVVNSFEDSDMRKSTWVDSVKPADVAYYYPAKYKIGKTSTSTEEYVMILRLGEQYLIRAEAMVHQDNLTAAQSDLNVIRTRAGLPNTTAEETNTLLDAIARERKVELFTEWGDRWFSLKRTDAANSVMPAVTIEKGGNWESGDQLYPIPLSEIQKASQLTQNPGY